MGHLLKLSTDNRTSKISRTIVKAIAIAKAVGIESPGKI